MQTDEGASKGKSCREASRIYSGYRDQLNGVVDRVISGCDDTRCYCHVDYEQLPSRSAVIEMIHKFREILFPGYFNRARLDPANLSYHIGQTVAELFDMLAEQISRSIRIYQGVTIML